jgi:hypothetical protein
MWDMAKVDCLVGRVAAGFHATIFAYGQTGSGKTHTMEGFSYNHNNGTAAPSTAAGRSKAKVKNATPEQLGIVPRSVHRLFAHAEALIAQRRSEGSTEENFSIKVSFLQIYKEKIFDLLNPSHTPAQREAGKGEEFAGLRMRWDAHRRQFFVENLFEYECGSAEEVLQHYANGVQNKHVASTAMNVASSRSHTVLVLTLVRTIGAVASPDNLMAPTSPAKEVVSKLALVDLAGSERASSSSASVPSNAGERGGARFQEAVNINQSLFVLRKVITALAKRSKASSTPSVHGGNHGRGHHAHHGHSGDAYHIPYRESKLTSLLQHAIGGNSFLLMVACLSPSDKHYEENLSTLQYASQAACIKNEPVVNIDPKDKLIDHLKGQLAAAHRYILRITGLSELPEEVLMAAPRRRGGHGPQRRIFSNDRPTPSASSSAMAASSQRHYSSDMGLGKGLTDEYGHDTGTPKAGTLRLASGSSLTEEQSKESCRPPASRGSESSADTIAVHTPEDDGWSVACPPTDLLLAAASYRPGANSRSQASPRDSGVVPPSPRKSSGSSRLPSSGLGRPSGAGDKMPRCQGARPPCIPAAWTQMKDALPPIAYGHSESLPTPVRATAPGDGLTAYAEVPLSLGSGWSSAMSKRRRREGSQPLRAQDIHRSESLEGCDACSGLEQAQRCTAETAAAAVDSGLWEALEELRIAKAALEDKLKGAEVREGALKVQLQELQPSQPCETVGTVEHMRSENDALRLSVSLLEERLEATKSWSQQPPQLCSEEKARREEETRAFQELRETMHSENEALKKERKALQERLDIFERALELESPKCGIMIAGELSQDGELPVQTTRLGEKLENLHSQFVLEVVALRKEVAGLKKKKWVLRSVLASGGESERMAIENEVMELRKSGGISISKAYESKDEVPSTPEVNMILTR